MSKGDDKVGNYAGEWLQNALNALVKGATGVEAKALIETAQQLCKVEQKAELKEIITGTGFASLKVKASIKQALFGTATQAVSSFTRTIEAQKKAKASAELLTCLELFRADMADGLMSGRSAFMMIQFHNGKGAVQTVQVVYAPGPAPTGGYFLGFGEINGEFVKAADYMVVAHSKNTFFKSKTWFELVKLPTDKNGVTAADVASIFSLVAAPMAAQLNDITTTFKLQ